MKTKILISIICACSLFKGQAQVFPTSDAIWNIQINWSEYYYGLSGDTIINSKLYNKLYFLNKSTLTIDSENMYIGGFRQDGKKVWFRPKHSNIHSYDDPYPEETILYDFSKDVGDTIWHNLDPYVYDWDDIHWGSRDSSYASIITSIDIDEQDRKIYHIDQYLVENGFFYSGGRKDRWIEGIGSIDHGLFWFLYGMTLSGYPKFHLACFRQGNEVKYLDCNACFCNGVTGILDKKSTLLEVIHENNCIRIQGESSVFPCELKLFSSTGQLILEKKLQSGTEKISVNQLNRIWLYQIQKNKKIIKTGKIIIK